MKHYTIAEISRQIDIPESTLRYRTKLFKKHIPTVNRGRRKRFKVEAIDRFKFIDKCFTDGMNTDDILDAIEIKFGHEVIMEDAKQKKSQSIAKKSSMKIDLEIMTPILKVIENQEIIIRELRIQNKRLAAPRRGFIKKLFS